MGLASAGTDLNPVAVLITKSMIEVPQKFNGLMPVSDQTSTQMHKGCEGLAKDVRYYGELLREQALSELSDLYPTAKITREMVESQPGLLEHLDKDVKVIAWLWTRTVESPNPALNGTHVPLVRSFWLANKRNRKTWLEPIIDGQSYSFQVKSGTEGPSVEGTVSRSGATCLITGSAIPFSYIREQGKQGKLGIRLLAIVAEGTRGKIYLPPNSQHEEMAGHIEVDNSPSTSLPDKALGFRVQEYGIKSHSKLFTKRQLKALVTFADLIPKLHETIRSDAEKAGLSPDQPGLDNNGRGALAYADAIAMYLSFAVDRLADFNSTICTWKSSGEQVMQTYKRQAIPMTWDFPESNILAKKSICWTNCVKYVADVLEKCFSFNNLYPGQATATDAATVDYQGKIISTDPPYYDNIGYADLSDFFYVWLRRSLKNVYPTLFQTALVPKLEELIATPFRHQSQGEAESFFMNGMKKVMGKLAKEAHPAYPVSIYYAFKQAEKSVDGLRSTGWETFLNAVIQAGFVITGTWPVRSEQATRMRNIGSNALASSIVLVCERRDIKAESVTRREFISFLKTELPPKIELLLKANIAPVDLQQAALGPGMAIFSRFDAVIESDGSKMKIGDALSIILQELEDCLSQDDSNYDGDTRWAIEWFKEYGFDEGPFGKADDLSRAKKHVGFGARSCGYMYIRERKGEATQ
jgi:putative DNA methylase